MFTGKLGSLNAFATRYTRVSEPSQTKSLTALTLLGLALPLLLVVIFPMMTDEAYYLDWTSRPPVFPLGFFDHPPFVAWQASLAKIWPSILSARVGVWCANAVAFFVNYKTALLIFANRRRAWLSSLLMQATLGVMANGFLLTPDSGLALWWSVALYTSIKALQGQPRYWIGAGCALGLGLWSKYTMILMGPIFLWGLYQEGRLQLRTRWPYLGALTAVVVFVPHLLWNAENGWITMKFQFGHGFSVRQSLSTGSTLPPAEGAVRGFSSMQRYEELQKALSGVSGFEEIRKKPRKEVSRLEQAWQYTGDYLGGVIGLWGVFSGIFLYAYYRRRESILVLDTSPKPVGRSLITGAALFPVIFFGALSPFTKIEANWPAMHLMAGAIFCSQYVRIKLHQIASAMIAHAVAASAIALLASRPDLIPSARNNRMVMETSGYDQLASFLAEKLPSDLLAVDSYQLKSALAVRNPRLNTVQWPRITRPSEYTRGAAVDREIEQFIMQSPEIHLLTFEDIPPELPGFEAVALEGIRSCPDGTIGSFSVSNPQLPCVKGLREWWLVSYRRI